VGTAGRDAKWVLDTTDPEDTSKLSHKDWIRDVAWSPCLSPTVQRVASCSEDRTVLIWTLDLSGVNGEKEGQQQQQQQKEEVSSNKNKKPMWVPHLLHTFEDPVWRVSWSLTGNILAVSSGDDSVTLWKQTLDGTWMQVSSVLEEQQQSKTSGGGDAMGAK
jgi:protein transport protein SEC13